MSLHEFLMQLLLLVVSFVVPVVGGFIINFLKAKTSNEKYTKYVWIAQIAVKAVEQKLGTTVSGAEKKKAVELYLSNKLKGVLSADEIDKLIETAVFEMKQIKVNAEPVATQPDTKVTEQTTTETIEPASKETIAPTPAPVVETKPTETPTVEKPADVIPIAAASDTTTTTTNPPVGA